MFTVTKGKKYAPVRAVIYGSEGIGKSTLAAQLPDPLFIDLENGTNELDVARIDVPTDWVMFMAELDWIYANPETCKTVVIDTADRAQELAEAMLLRQYGTDSIEKIGGGYGKGYTALLELWRKDLIERLDKLIARGLNVCLLAHAVMRKQENPDDPPYDRWELNLQKKIAPAVRAWADLLLFCNWEVFVVEENGRAKAKGSAKRVMFSEHRPTFDAKNRYGLPEKMNLEYTSALRDVFERRTERQHPATVLNYDTPTEGIIEDEILESPLAAFTRHLEQEKIHPEAVADYLKKRGKLAENGLLGDLSDEYLERLDSNLPALKKELKKMEDKK